MDEDEREEGMKEREMEKTYTEQNRITKAKPEGKERKTYIPKNKKLTS